MEKDVFAMAAKTTELKRRIDQTFDIPNVKAFKGLSDLLISMGHRSTAFALEQLIEDEAEADDKTPLSPQHPQTRRPGT